MKVYTFKRAGSSYYCNTVCMFKLTVAEEYECNGNVNKRLQQHSFERSSLLQGLNCTTVVAQAELWERLLQQRCVCVLIEGFCSLLTLLH